MNKQLEENNYLLVDNFISAEEAKKYYEGLKQDFILHPNEFNADIQCPLSASIYNYRWFVELLTYKTATVSELVDEPVLPTYAFARLYKNNEVLSKHIDRPECEISMTIHLGSDGTPWPINFTRPNGEVVSVELQPGQGVIYLGCISAHWRDKFEGEEYGQVFLHYVRSRGDNWWRVFDTQRKL